MTDQDPVVYNGRYEVQHRIARGGMAEVFLARDLLLARPVAVKVLFAEFAGDPSFVARFRREAQAAANLTHPNIVGVYDWGQEGGTYYIVMEFVDGKSLSEILKSEGLPPPDAAAGIAADVAAALGWAHRNGVVHRDVKPGNIMVTSNGHVKVADFGIARAIHGGADEHLTQTGSVMGTATYFSPEQAQGHDVDPRSDLYSLGVVMYEMATGKPPFSGDSPVAIAFKHVQEPPDPPSHVNPAIPAAYEAITLKLLAKDPADRYATAELLRADLRRFMQGQRIEATPPPVVLPDPAQAPIPTVAERRAPVVTDAPTTGRRTWLFIVVLVILLAVLGGLLFAFAKTLGLTAASKNVTVPSVVNKNVLQAVNDLTAAKLDADYSGREANPTVPKNYVISQDPAAGTKVEQKTRVTLIISTGPVAPATVNLPDVTGMTVAAAQSTLCPSPGADNCFQSTISQSFSDNVPVGNVVTMSPIGGPSAEYPKTTIVILTVSTGPDPSKTTTTQAVSTTPQSTAPAVTTTLPASTVPPPTTAPTTAPGPPTTAP